MVFGATVCARQKTKARGVCVSTMVRDEIRYSRTGAATGAGTVSIGPDVCSRK